jgi:peptidyl-prolyl cis-trans isomerase B (cyclophilin B)
MGRLRLAPLLALLSVLALAGCGGGKTTTTTVTQTVTETVTVTTPGGEASSGPCKDVEAPTPASRQSPKPTGTLDPSKTYDVTIQTNCGSFTFRLDQEQSPNAAASIVSLVEDGFYDNTVFHRIVPGFVIQGGDPTQTGSDGPGYTTVDTPPSGASYTKGTVAMAKSGLEPAGTAGSQFFVVTRADAGLTPDYAVVGHIVKGQNVVDEIGKWGMNTQEGTPTKVIVVEKATVAES